MKVVWNNSERAVLKKAIGLILLLFLLSPFFVFKAAQGECLWWIVNSDADQKSMLTFYNVDTDTYGSYEIEQDSYIVANIGPSDALFYAYDEGDTIVLSEFGGERYRIEKEASFRNPFVYASDGETAYILECKYSEELKEYAEELEERKCDIYRYGLSDASYERIDIDFTYDPSVGNLILYNDTALMLEREEEDLLGYGFTADIYSVTTEYDISDPNDIRLLDRNRSDLWIESIARCSSGYYAFVDYPSLCSTMRLSRNQTEHFKNRCKEFAFVVYEELLNKTFKEMLEEGKFYYGYGVISGYYFFLCRLDLESTDLVPQIVRYSDGRELIMDVDWAFRKSHIAIDSNDDRIAFMCSPRYMYGFSDDSCGDFVEDVYLVLYSTLDGSISLLDFYGSGDTKGPQGQWEDAYVNEGVSYSNKLQFTKDPIVLSADS